MTRFEPSLVQIGCTVRPVALAKKPKKKKKTAANWLFAQTTHVAVSMSKFACRVASGVQFYIYQVSLKSVQWFCRCGWSKIALSHYLAIGLYNSLYTVQAVITYQYIEVEITVVPVVGLHQWSVVVTISLSYIVSEILPRLYCTSMTTALSKAGRLMIRRKYCIVPLVFHYNFCNGPWTFYTMTLLIYSF